MNYPFLIILAFLPSFIWLLFYLRKDAHPESNSMVLKIFFYGMFAAILAVFVELGFFQITAELPFPSFLISLLNIFIAISLTEEVFKYLVVRIKILSSPELDEPLDVMLYMIIAALGFAASENLLLFLSPKISPLKIEEVLILTSLRFILATFLHALVSGMLGYFLALSFFKTEKKYSLFATGLALATILHGFYNLAIIQLQLPRDLQYIRDLQYKYILPIILLIIILGGLAIFVSLSFKKLKKLKSVCKI